MEYRIEKDTMGEIKVPADKLWGAQTQRSLENFKIGTEKMPTEIIDAMAIVKKGAAKANLKLGVLDPTIGGAIISACDEILEGRLKDNFPLVVWQTGSGTQTNMNLNEVIANRANEILGEKIVHPNDHVNKSQSSNDTFPSAMSIAGLISVEKTLYPAFKKIIEALKKLEVENKDVVKIARTHLQDATPITLGQEISGWVAMLEKSKNMIELAQPGMKELALGGTAVGTGLNAHKDFGVAVATEITEMTGLPFVTAPNKFHSLTSKDTMVFAHGALKALAGDLMKIANDVRWLASGPRCGIGEIFIPENEPGSSIMPGKVNPTQSEALTMISVQIMGNDTTIGVASSQGNFQLNVFMPVIIFNYLQSVRLLADGMVSFADNCIAGIKPNKKVIEENLEKSLMNVTALNPHIGYEKAAEVAKKAHKEDTTLLEAVLELGYMTEEEFKKAVNPSKMV